MSRMLRPILVLTTLILLGTGCIGTSETTTTTSTTEAVIKAPASVIARATADSLAAKRSKSACTSAGYQVITRFNTASATSEEFCQFPDGTECEINAFGSGRCTDKTGIARPDATEPAAVVASIDCDDTSPLVCGVNGHTYQNKCLAVETNIAIAHVGACSAEEVARSVPPGAPTERDIPKQTVRDRVSEVFQPSTDEDDVVEVPPAAVYDPEVASQSSHPAWIDTTISLIEATEPTTPPMYIDRCTREGVSYYLETNGTGEVVSTAYTISGETICYPNRDFSNSCPDEIVFRGNCSRVYTDTR